MSPPVALAPAQRGTPPNVARAVRDITSTLRRPLLDRQLTYTEGALVFRALDANRVTEQNVPALLSGLERTGMLDAFFQTAHPRWGPDVRAWLHDHGVPWSVVHDHYVYDWHDSVDFFAGYLAGMGVALADLPIMLAKLGKITLEGKLVDEAQKFFARITELWQKELKQVLAEAADQWIEAYDGHVYRLEWPQAGYLLGNTITNIVIFGKAAAKALIGLPKFVKAVPAALKEYAEVVRKTAGIVVRTAEDAIKLIREALGAIFLAPDLRYSRLLAVIATPGEIRKLFTEDFVRFVTKTGYEFIYVPGKDSLKEGAYLGAGPLPNHFLGSSVVLIRRNGKIIARIHRPGSLADIIKGLGDDDWQGLLKRLEDVDKPAATLSREDLAKLTDKARASPEFADTALTFNVRFVLEDFLKVAKARLAAMQKALKPGAKLNPATFGTLVESDMKPVIDKLEKTYKHITFFRKKTLKDILGAHLPAESKFLEKTVEEFVRQNGMLATTIGYDGKNLAQVLAAKATTKLGELEVDLFLMDEFGHQGLLLDWTSVAVEAHLHKTLLYHAVITDVFKNIRLPFGEMFHFGLTE